MVLEELYGAVYQKPGVFFFLLPCPGFCLLRGATACDGCGTWLQGLLVFVQRADAGVGCLYTSLTIRLCELRKCCSVVFYCCSCCFFVSFLSSLFSSSLYLFIYLFIYCFCFSLIFFLLLLSLGAGIACWLGLVIERLRVRIPAGAEGECSPPELTLCADSYSVSVPPPCHGSGTKKTPVILPKVQEAGYT